MPDQGLVDAGHHHGGVEEIQGVPRQITPTPGMPERKAVARRQARVREILHTLPPAAQAAIVESLEEGDAASAYPEDGYRHDDTGFNDADTQVIPVQAVDDHRHPQDR